jgi:uncharacterized membrane protein
MKQIGNYVVKALIGGAIVVVPIYLAILLLLKAAGSLLTLVQPIAALLPEWFPAENVLSLLLVLIVCFLVGIAVRTPTGRAARERIEKSLFQRIPGYALLRSLTQRIADESQENAWKPALVEIEEALVPAFIIEQLDDGRYTVFVPSVPTPFAGAVYILENKRVHPLNVPFTQAIKTVSRWGSGSGDLVAAMEKAEQQA